MKKYYILLFCTLVVSDEIKNGTIENKDGTEKFGIEKIEKVKNKNRTEKFGMEKFEKENKYRKEYETESKESGKKIEAENKSKPENKYRSEHFEEDNKSRAENKYGERNKFGEGNKFGEKNKFVEEISNGTGYSTEKMDKIEMLRITQPSEMETLPKVNKSEMTTKPSSFKASPQLESYFEYNRFPVRPAWPESKQVKTFQQLQSQINFDKQNYQSFYPGSSSTIIPITRSSYAEDKRGKPIRSDHDYSPLKFYDKFNYGSPTPSYPITPSYPNTPSYPITPTYSITPSYPITPPAPNFDWFNTISFPENKPEHPYPFVSQSSNEHKNDFATYSPHKTLEYEEGHSLESHGPPKKSPWKKLVKFLTAIIPIGLLLSALTPTIVTVGTPYNTTYPQYCRKDGARLDDDHILSHFEEQWTKNYGCAAKELCELSIEGKTPNVEVIKRIVALASSHEDEEEAILKLDLITNAVKNKKCNIIPCQNFKTERWNSKID